MHEFRETKTTDFALRQRIGDEGSGRHACNTLNEVLAEASRSAEVTHNHR